MRRAKRGILLVTLLMILGVVLMWSAALLNLNRGELASGDHYRDRLKALQLARGGLNHAAQVLTNDSSFSGDISWGDSLRGYQISFSGPTESRSVNNLDNLPPGPITNFRGEDVPGHTADLLVTAWQGQRRVRVRGLIRRGFSLNASVVSTERVVLDGDMTLKGVTSLTDPTPRGGGVVSVYRSTSANDHAVSWANSGPGTFLMEGEARIQSGPEADSAYHSISPNLKALYPDRTDEGAANQPPPRFSVGETVVAGSSNPAPTDVVLSGGAYRLGYSQINDQRYVGGNLEVTGDLNLAGGTLYVNGDLTLNGGIHGIGSVFVDGSVSINGGNSVVLTNQSSGAALFSSGDVTLTGIDASGYLDSLASWYPDIGVAKGDLEAAWSGLTGVANRVPTGPDAESLWAFTQALSWDQLDRTNYWVNPIRGPQGTYAHASTTKPIPKLTLAIKNSLGPGYDTDVKAQKIVQAMEQTHHNFRFNYFNAPATYTADPATYTIPGVSPAEYYDNEVAGWDDSIYLAVPPPPPPNDLLPWTPTGAVANGKRFKDLTFDHKYRASGDKVGMAPHQVELRSQMFAQAKAFTDMHPLDFGWLGDSFFQGLVYAEGQVSVDNRFHVIGSLISHGRVQLTGGSSLTYNDEYTDAVGAAGPVRVAAYEEL